MNINFAFLVVLALLNGTSSGNETTTAITQPTSAVDDAGKAAEGKTLLNATNTPVSSTKKITSTSSNNTAGTDKKPEEKENVLSTAGGVLHETSKNVHTIIKKNGSATTTTASTKATTTTASTKAITTAASTKATTTTASTKATTTTASTKVADAPSSAASVPNATSPVVPAIIKNNGTGKAAEGNTLLNTVNTSVPSIKNITSTSPNYTGKAAEGNTLLNAVNTSVASIKNITSTSSNNSTGTDKENISSSAGSVPVTTSQNVEISKKDEADTPPAMKEVTDPVRNVPDLENDQRQGQFDVHSKKALPQPEEEPSTNFPVLFMISILAIVGGYFLYHNKSKIMGLIVEGRGSTSRRPRYNRLKNVEEAMPGMRNKISA